MKIKEKDEVRMILVDERLFNSIQDLVIKELENRHIIYLPDWDELPIAPSANWVPRCHRTGVGAGCTGAHINSKTLKDMVEIAPECQECTYYKRD